MDIDTHGKCFLEKVIETNAIAFADEYRWRTWTAGFYLNNAKHRILRLDPTATVSEGISNAVLKRTWARLFFELDRILRG